VRLRVLDLNESKMYKLLELGLVVGVIVVTITRGSLFSWLRDWMWKRGEFVGNLFSCPYCLAHWVSLWIVLLGNPGLIFHPYKLILSVFAVIGISMVCGWIVYRCYKGIVDAPDLSGENEALREALGKARAMLEELSVKVE
jgi:hypothetical protein